MVIFLYVVVVVFVCFFFFKQKTAYEMRISDWSSDVCSSDLIEPVPKISSDRINRAREWPPTLCEDEPVFAVFAKLHDSSLSGVEDMEIGRASCRERVCQYV